MVAFELRAVELVRHTISGTARQAWTATRIQRPEEALIPDRRGLDGQILNLDSDCSRCKAQMSRAMIQWEPSSNRTDRGRFAGPRTD